MFQMFGFGGTPCPRCERKSPEGATYCAACGISLGAVRSAPVLVENRWIAGPDELAVFFGVRELSGLFVKTLRVPATARAYILQGDAATEVPQGEYEIEGFFSRLNHLLRDGHAEILVTRTNALPVAFDLQLETAEHLVVQACFTVEVRIENVPAFARHFMTMPGTVTVAQLHELLEPGVRQLAAEFIGSQSLREMAANRELRGQFDERLQGALRLQLAGYGLGVAAVRTLALRHDKFDANRARIGTLWLAADERRVQMEHARRLEELYDEQEWHKLRREEGAARLRLRRLEQGQAETLERGEATLAGSERHLALRAREIELYGRIMEARSRREAIDRGAGETLAELEHALAQKHLARAGEAAGWAHVQALAQVRMRGALELAQGEAVQARRLAHQRFAQQLLVQQIRNKVEQAAAIEDAAQRRAALARVHAEEEGAARRARALDEEEHKTRFELARQANAARRRAAEREAEWLEQQEGARLRAARRGEELDAEGVRQQIETLRRAGGQQDAIAQHEKLLRTIEAEARQARAEKEVELLAGERLAAQELARAAALDALDDTTKLALAAAPNAAVLADYLKTRVLATMDAGQLAALAGVVAAGGAMSALDAARMVDEALERERQRREREVDKDRAHQLALLALQNDVNKAALGAQARVAAAGAARCVNGHALGAGEPRCPACGAGARS